MIPTTSAVIVTRGDVNLDKIIQSLERPPFDEVIVWDNGLRKVLRYGNTQRPLVAARDVPDLSVYGRYAAIQYAAGDLIFFQDDDCIVSDPQAIRDAWMPGHLVCNMPERFRHEGYTDSALVGFGSIVERGLPERAFQRYAFNVLLPGRQNIGQMLDGGEVFNRTCDVVFTTLTPRILVDVLHEDLLYASDVTRMWTQPGHLEERIKMLTLARKVRDACV